MPEYNPDTGPEPQKSYPHGWWILPAVLICFLCALLLVLLLPWLKTSGAAYGFVAIALTGSLLAGLLMKWMSS